MNKKEELISQSHFLHVKDVATILNISQNTAYKYVHTGIIPSISVGKTILIPISYVENLLNK